MEDGDPEGYPTMLDCPYVAGVPLSLFFKSEGEPREAPAHDLTVEIVKPLYPFTCSQALLVDVTSSTQIDIPKRLVLKLQDRRFRRTMGFERNIYNPDLDDAVRRGLYAILHEGKRPNPFHLLDGHDEFPDAEDPEYEPWMDQVEDWTLGQRSLTSEANAYRHMSSVQGTLVPRFFGTVQYQIRTPSDVVDPPNFIHPVLDSVDGIALEYIDGVNLQSLTLGVDITEEEADRVSQGIFSALRELRRLRICHDDLRLANVMVRKDDFDHPVLIDFAWASYKTADETDEEWACSLPYSQVERMRRILRDSGFHTPSPYPRYCKPDPLTGYVSLNNQVEFLTPSVREKLYEPLELDGLEYIIKTDNEGKEHRWYFPKWRPRPGIRFAPDSDLDRL